MYNTLTCPAQEAKNRNNSDFQKHYPDAVKSILKQHYMDDHLDGANNEEEGIKLVQLEKAREIVRIYKEERFTIFAGCFLV